MQSKSKLFQFSTLAFLGTFCAFQQSVAQKKFASIYADDKYVLEYVIGTEELKEKNDQFLFSFVVQSQNLEEKTVEIEKISVSLNECLEGAGRIKFFDTKNKFKEESDYIIGGASIGSAIAKSACELAIKSVREAIDSKKN